MKIKNIVSALLVFSSMTLHAQRQETRNKVQTMPGGGNATVRIELPGNWNSLMEELGYPPIEQFYL